MNMKYWGKNIVWALHPAQPSEDLNGHSRGRKRHLAKDDDKTYCNMTNAGEFLKGQVNNGMCISCMNNFKRNR